jgi:hypothetical protein
VSSDDRIFLESILDHKDLCALALVSRGISGLARPALCSQITIPLLGKKHKCFLRTLSKCPELGSYVWEAHLERAQDWRVKSEECFREAQTLLRMLPALRTLKLAYFECSYEHTSVFDIQMPHIITEERRTLNIDSWQYLFATSFSIMATNQHWNVTSQMAADLA